MPPRAQSRDPHTDLGAFLGQQLREIRAEAGYRSQDAFAPVLGTDRSVIGKGETGEYPPTEAVLEHWLDLCGISGRLKTVLLGVARFARMKDDPGRYQTIGWFETEAAAHTLRYWAPLTIPGLVQTSAYAGALFTAMGYDDAKVGELVGDRTARQAILTRPSPPDITIVLWEPVLRHPTGSPEVMREQLARLLAVSRMPTVMLQVLPSRVGVNAGQGGAINLATADNTPELLLSDGLVEDVVTADVARVRRASTIFNTVRADALNRADSRAVISEAMETCN
jgi:hypothetical protein